MKKYNVIFSDLDGTLINTITVTPTHELVPYSTTMFGAYTFADGTPFGVKIE